MDGCHTWKDRCYFMNADVIYGWINIRYEWTNVILWMDGCYIWMDRCYFMNGQMLYERTDVILWMEGHYTWMDRRRIGMDRHRFMNGRTWVRSLPPPDGAKAALFRSKCVWTNMQRGGGVGRGRGGVCSVVAPQFTAQLRRRQRCNKYSASVPAVGGGRGWKGGRGGSSSTDPSSASGAATTGWERRKKRRRFFQRSGSFCRPILRSPKPAPHRQVPWKVLTYEMSFFSAFSYFFFHSFLFNWRWSPYRRAWGRSGSHPSFLPFFLPSFFLPSFLLSFLLPPPGPCTAALHSVRRMMWIPDSVNTGPLISPALSANEASSKGFCIWPRPKAPRSPPAFAELQSLNCEARDSKSSSPDLIFWM